MKYVNDKTFNEALKNSDNKAIITTVLKKYSGVLDWDTLQQCGNLGLWRCLQQHNSDKNKFTNSLWRHVNWICLQELTQYNKNNRYKTNFENPIEQEWCENEEIQDILNSLDEQSAVVLKMRYFENLTMKEISSRLNISVFKAGNLIKTAISQAKELVLV